MEEAKGSLNALRAAREALFNITVNGRNFYPQGPNAIQTATEEFNRMMVRFDSVFNEVTAYAEAIYKGGHKET